MSIISDGIIYAVNGMTSRNIPIRGFTIDPINQNVTEFWGPESSVSNILHFQCNNYFYYKFLVHLIVRKSN